MSDVNMRILLSALGGASVAGTFNQVASSANNMGSVLLGISAIAVGIGVASVNMAADYQQSMLKVQALTGSSNAQMQQYDSGLKQLAVNAGAAPKALADGLYNVISAGYSGSSAMQLLTLSTEDSKIGMTSAAVTSDALTNVMASFSSKVSDATRVNGEMLETVTLGKSTFEQYATSIVKSASSAAQFHVSMETMNAAFATMTSSGIRAAQASTDFQQSLKVMDGNIGTVAKSLHSSGIAFDENKFNAMSYGDKVLYLNNALQTANREHVKVTGVTLQASQAISTIAAHIDTYNHDLALLSDRNAMAQKTQQAWQVTQEGFNQQLSRAQAAVQVLMIGIGQMLLPVLTNLLSSVTPLISSFANWVSSGHAVSDMLTFFHQHAQIVIPVLAGIGAIILSVLVPAMASLAVEVVIATWPFLLIGAAVAGLAAIFMHFYQTNAPFKAFIDNLINGFKQLWSIIQASFAPAMQDVGNIMQSKVMPAFQLVGSWLQSTFKPVWDQLVSTIQGQVVPTWNSLVSAIRPVLPQLQMFAEIIGGAVFGAVSLVIGVIGGVIHAFASFLSGFITVIGGVIQVVSGIVKVVSGIISFIVDIATGKFGKLKGDIGLIFDGIGTIAQGMWQMIKGFFQEGIGAVVGFVSGFIQTIQGIFTSLANILVGHSIVPDMINAIVQFFADLPGRAAGAVISILSTIGSIFSNLASQAGSQISNLVGNVVNWLSQLPGRAGSAISGIIGTITGVLGEAAGAALNAGANIVNSIASGIEGAIGAVGAAIGNVASFISAHLPHSPAKIGPLRDLVLQGSLITQQISDGMLQGAPYLSNALQTTLAPVASIGTRSPDSGILADQLSFAVAPSTISSGTKKPVETAATKKAQENRLKGAEKTVANEFKSIDAEMKALTKRESTKEANERKRYAAEIKAIEERDKHLKGNAKKSGEEEIKALRAQEKRQLANERKAFDAKIKADRAKERQLKQEIHLNLTVHATKLDAAEVDKLAAEMVKRFGDQIRAQFGNI